MSLEKSRLVKGLLFSSHSISENITCLVALLGSVLFVSPRTKALSPLVVAKVRFSHHYAAVAAISHRSEYFRTKFYMHYLHAILIGVSKFDLQVRN